MDNKELEKWFRARERSMYGRTFLVDNPVMWVQPDLLKIRALSQYSALVMWIVPILERVRDRALERGWTQVAAELDRNIAEENGSESGGVPHRDIFTRHMRAAGISIPVCEAGPDIEVYGTQTQAFIKFLQSRTRPSDRRKHDLHRGAYSVGVALALEATATPELCVVARLINRLMDPTGRHMVIEEEILQGQYCADSPDSLRGFFSHHIREWEQGHRDGLEDVIAATPELCTPEALRIMEEAFNEVLHIMDTWWRALAKL